MPPLYPPDPFSSAHQALHARWLDLPMAALSVACEAWVLALVALAIYSWAERDVPSVLEIFVPLALALAAGVALRDVVRLATATPHPVGPGHPGALFRSGFPSGAALAGATFAAYTVAAYGRRGLPALAVAALGAVAAAHGGARWVPDVLGGWAVGAALGLLAWLGALRAFRRGRLSRLRSERRAPREAAPGPPAA